MTAFSHGCVRVEKPIELAAHLLREPDRDPWTQKQVEQMIRRGKPTYIKLPRPIEVHFVYRTAWVDGNGTVHFRPNIYHHTDTTSEQALRLVASR